MSKSKGAAERALAYMRQSTRVGLRHPRDNYGATTLGRQIRSKDNKAGKSQKMISNAAKPPLGWIFGDFYNSYVDKHPAEKQYNALAHLRREYPPLSLIELQRLIDLGWVDPNKPIDLTTLVGTQQYSIDPAIQQFGVQLTDEGADLFTSRVNIEVQAANELVIASIERVGGRITCAYMDPIALDVAINPVKHFQSGVPIPKRGFPPVDIMLRYTNPDNRGYLAPIDNIEDARFTLANKYGYKYNPINLNDPLMSQIKDPLQIFYGLSPGSVVNLKDKVVLHPTDPQLIEYYRQ